MKQNNFFSFPTWVGVIMLLLILMSFFSVNVSGKDELHPSLLFNDISEVPGYQYRTENPWNSWENSVFYSADKSLSRDFSEPEWSTYDRIIYRSEFARDLGLAYQITKDSKYAEKTKEALLNIGFGEDRYAGRSGAVRNYGLAYDWVQPYLSEEDDRAIRNNMQHLLMKFFLN